MSNLYYPICARGFSCPYRGYDTDGDPICIYPYHPTNPDIEEETFGLISDMSFMDCPLMDPDGELQEILNKNADSIVQENIRALYG